MSVGDKDVSPEFRHSLSIVAGPFTIIRKTVPAGEKSRPPSGTERGMRIFLRGRGEGGREGQKAPP
ncbi:MAG: hypothetical protein D6713_02070 [Deltaproteobacteria bacterium]|nr:MAG: hypothetical protein D6713_02070 [Deltaproteobacteria bacterium]